MFKTTKNKVLVSMVLTISICFYLASLACYIGAKNILIKNYTDLTLNNINQQYENTGLFKQMIENSARRVTEDKAVISAIQVKGFDTSIIAKLDSLEAINLSVIGASLYSYKGYNYFSSSVHNSPANKIIFEEKQISSFIASEDQSKWILRSDDLPNYTNYFFAQENKHMITFISKIKSANNTSCGLLLADVHVSSFFDYFRGKTNTNDNSTDLYLLTSDSRLISDIKNPTGNPLIQQDMINRLVNGPIQYTYTDNKKNTLLVLHKLAEPNVFIIIATSLQSQLDNLNILSNILVVLTLVLIFIVTLYYTRLSKNIFNRLSKLYTRIKNNSTR